MSYMPTPPPGIHKVAPLPKVDMQGINELRAEVVGVARGVAYQIDGKPELIDLTTIREALRDVLTRLDDAQRRYLVMCDAPEAKEGE